MGQHQHHPSPQPNGSYSSHGIQHFAICQLCCYKNDNNYNNNSKTKTNVTVRNKRPFTNDLAHRISLCWLKFSSQIGSVCSFGPGGGIPGWESKSPTSDPVTPFLLCDLRQVTTLSHHFSITSGVDNVSSVFPGLWREAQEIKG